MMKALNLPKHTIIMTCYDTMSYKIWLKILGHNSTYKHLLTYYVMALRKAVIHLGYQIIFHNSDLTMRKYEDFFVSFYAFLSIYPSIYLSIYLTGFHKVEHLNMFVFLSVTLAWFVHFHLKKCCQTKPVKSISD